MACHHKRAWFDVNEACRAANRTTYKNKQAGRNEVVRAYLCPRCGLYHVGRGRRGQDEPGLEVEKTK